MTRPTRTGLSPKKGSVLSTSCAPATNPCEIGDPKTFRCRELKRRWFHRSRGQRPGQRAGRATGCARRCSSDCTRQADRIDTNLLQMQRIAADHVVVAGIFERDTILGRVKHQHFVATIDLLFHSGVESCRSCNPNSARELAHRGSSPTQPRSRAASSTGCRGNCRPNSNQTPGEVARRLRCDCRRIDQPIAARWDR